jgi:hypothetical protein
MKSKPIITINKDNMCAQLNTNQEIDQKLNQIGVKEPKKD